MTAVLARLALIATLATLAIVPGSLAGTTRGGVTAFVAAEDDNAVVVVDIASGRVVKRIPVKAPHNVAATADGRTIVATSPDAGRVTVISGTTLRVARVFSGLGTPYGVALSADGRYAYVTEKEKGKLDVFDLRARRVVGSVAAGVDPQYLALGSRLWIAHGRSGGASLTGVDVSAPASPRVVTNVDTQGPVHDVSVQPGSANVYFTYWDSRLLGGVDTGTGRLLFKRQAGRDLQHVVFDHFSGNRIWVTDHGANKVLLLSARNGSLIHSIACPSAHNVALATGRVAATCHDRLLLFTPSFRGVRSIPAGRGLHGVALTTRR